MRTQHLSKADMESVGFDFIVHRAMESVGFGFIVHWAISTGDLAVTGLADGSAFYVFVVVPGALLWREESDQRETKCALLHRPISTKYFCSLKLEHQPYTPRQFVQGSVGNDCHCAMVIALFTLH